MPVVKENEHGPRVDDHRIITNPSRHHLQHPTTTIKMMTRRDKGILLMAVVAVRLQLNQCPLCRLLSCHQYRRRYHHPLHHWLLLDKLILITNTTTTRIEAMIMTKRKSTNHHHHHHHHHNHYHHHLIKEKQQQ